MNLQEYCDCSVPLTHITSAELSCQGETEIIFRARIYSTPDANSTFLISKLEQWIASAPSIVVQSNRLNLDPQCDIRLQSTDDSFCPKPTSPPPLGVIAGAAVGGVGVIIAVILALYIFRKIRRRKSYNIR